MKSIRLFLIGFCLLGFASPSWAFLREYIPQLTPTQQVIQADIIVVGTIVEIEESDSEATTHPGSGQKTAYKIANVKINDALVGGKGLTHIRIGFIPTNRPIQNPQVEGLGEDWGPQPDSYSIDDEGCFFLQKHHEGNFYILLQYGHRLDAKHQSYEGDLGKIKRMIEVFEKPMDALKAKDSDDRQFAASSLIHKYKSAPNGGRGVNKEVEISKEESDLILKALGEMEKDDEQLTNFTTLFHMLQLTNRDGWVQPPLKEEGGGNNKIMKEAFDKWYKAHGEKYRMKKWVSSKK